MRILVASDFWSRNNFLSRKILVHLQPGDILSLFTRCVIPAARPRLLITSQTTLPSVASCNVRQVTTASSHVSRRVTTWYTGAADELIRHIYSTACHCLSSRFIHIQFEDSMVFLSTSVIIPRLSLPRIPSTFIADQSVWDKNPRQPTSMAVYVTFHPLLLISSHNS